jgi:hypothetical protein
MESAIPDEPRGEPPKHDAGDDDHVQSVSEHQTDRAVKRLACLGRVQVRILV